MLVSVRPRIAVKSIGQAFNDALDAEFKSTDKEAIARTGKNPGSAREAAQLL